jgi:hypothetical protein
MTKYQIIMKEPYYDFLDNQTLKGDLILDDISHKYCAIPCGPPGSAIWPTHNRDNQPVDCAG